MNASEKQTVVILVDDKSRLSKLENALKIEGYDVLYPDPTRWVREDQILDLVIEKIDSLRSNAADNPRKFVLVLDVAFKIEALGGLNLYSDMLKRGALDRLARVFILSNYVGIKDEHASQITKKILVFANDNNIPSHDVLHFENSNISYVLNEIKSMP